MLIKEKSYHYDIIISNGFAQKNKFKWILNYEKLEWSWLVCRFNGENFL